jgi:transposase
MEILHAYCAGIDAHKKVVVVSVIVADANRRLCKETRTFDTMTASLLALSDWLTAHAVTQLRPHRTRAQRAL